MGGASQWTESCATLQCRWPQHARHARSACPHCSPAIHTSPPHPHTLLPSHTHLPAPPLPAAPTRTAPAAPPASPTCAPFAPCSTSRPTSCSGAWTRPRASAWTAKSRTAAGEAAAGAGARWTRVIRATCELAAPAVAGGGERDHPAAYRTPTCGASFSSLSSARHWLLARSCQDDADKCDWCDDGFWNDEKKGACVPCGDVLEHCTR